MTHEMIWELIGYLGSLLVVVSLLMSSVIKLRIINTLGSLIFCIYALVIRSYPTAVMNAALVAINIWFLVKLINKDKAFILLEVSAQDATAMHMLERYGEDIAKYFPDCRERFKEADKVFLALQNDNLAGITLGKSTGKDFLLLTDYSTPQYRDCKLGSFVYERLHEMGFEKLCYDGKNEIHIEYLKKMGFAEENGMYVKQ